MKCHGVSKCAVCACPGARGRTVCGGAAGGGACGAGDCCRGVIDECTGGSVALDGVEALEHDVERSLVEVALSLTLQLMEFSGRFAIPFVVVLHVVWK